MTNNNALSKEALAELISFIAENESFATVQKDLAGALEVSEVRKVLKEHALCLKREAASESGVDGDATKGVGLSRKSKSVLSCLSSYEEEKILKAFGFPGL